MFEIDREVIIDTLYSSKYERRDSIFLLDTELDLIEYQCNKNIMKTYLNKHKVKDHIGIHYRKDLKKVSISLDDKLEHLVIFVTTMTEDGLEPMRYQLVKYKIDYENNFLVYAGLSMDRQHKPNCVFHNLLQGISINEDASRIYLKHSTQFK